MYKIVGYPFDNISDIGKKIARQNFCCSPIPSLPKPIKRRAETVFSLPNPQSVPTALKAD